MKLLFRAGSLFLLILNLSHFLQAQTQPSTPKPNYLKMDTRIYKKVNDPCCERFFVDGVEYLTMKTGSGLWFALAIVERGNYDVAELYIANGSDKKVTVNPALAYMELWKDEKGLLDKPPFYVGKPIPAHTIAKKLQNKAAWANFFTRFSASFQNQQIVTRTTSSGTATAIGSGGMVTGTYNGTSATTTTIPDYQARAAAENTAQARSAQAVANGASYMNDEMLANTLWPKQDIFGRIYFSLKKYHSATFVIEIEGKEYAFLFSLKQGGK
jgi:hypothetical protein